MKSTIIGVALILNVIIAFIAVAADSMERHVAEGRGVLGIVLVCVHLGIGAIVARSVYRDWIR